MLKFVEVPEIELIKANINSIQDKNERFHFNFSMLVALHVFQPNNYLINESIAFIDTLFNQPSLYDESNSNSDIDSAVYLDYSEHSENSDTSRIIQSNTYFSILSFKDSNLLTHQQKIFWVLATVKLLLSQNNINHNAVSKAIGILNVLLESTNNIDTLTKTDDNIYLDFKMLEIQLYLLLFQKGRYC